MKKNGRRNARGFTLVEAAALCLVGAGVLAGGIASQPNDEAALARARQSARQLKDATQIRAIVQAMMIWSQMNKDVYPLPSMIDKQDSTVADKGRAKDTTANILSILAWNGSISPELCISPLENNARIKACDGFEFTNPKTAVRPVNALWDPAFNCDFTGAKPGNNSYAHLQPSGVINAGDWTKTTGRVQRWSSTFNAAEPIVSTRGPEVASVQYGEELKVTPKYANEKSNTFSFYKPAGSWSGNVAFNDNHVEFLDKYLTPGQTFKAGASFKIGEDKTRADIAFFDEPDDPKGVNNFLGIFIKAGEKPSEFKAIWD